MAGEFSSGIRFNEGDVIKGYKIVRVFDPGGFAFAGRAIAPGGRPVFFKKYKRPGGSSAWFDGFVQYQNDLKRRVQADDGARRLCYEFIEFFELNKAGGAVKLRAFYQVFEWVEGGTDLAGVAGGGKHGGPIYDWPQRVIFARVMMAGVNALHKAGIVHSDLKPQNFYLLPEPAIAAKYKLRVIDLDFSLIEGRQAPWHGIDGYTGTPGYLSPEHMSGKVPQKASDVFTCGLILGELLGSGHPSADNMDAYDERAKSGSLAKVSVTKPIPEAADLVFVNQVINSAFRPELSKRPTAEQILQALNGRLSEWDGQRPSTGKAVVVPAPPASPVSPGKPAVPVPPAPAVASSGAVQIAGEGGQRLKVNIGATFGRDTFKTWGPDFERFMAREQFTLFKDPSGCWMVSHCTPAPNATNANGMAIVKPIPVVSGMRVSLGKTGKCPIVLHLAGARP